MYKCNFAPIASALLLCSTAVQADWSGTVTLASDYMFNGVSQTNNDPALQGSVDYVADNGIYAGVWTSNVDYGASADREIDPYVGQYIQFTDTWGVDYGIAYYTYHNGNNSSSLNYPEIYAKLSRVADFGTTGFNFWYTWDYFGTGADHAIGMLTHRYSFLENHAIFVGIDYSKSLDEDKYAWEANGDTSYVHYKLAYQTSWNGFAIELSAENTTLNNNNLADERLVAMVSRTFNF